jgi:hypothetical protein
VFDPGSRYAAIEVAETTVRGGDDVDRTVRYVRRRLLRRVDDHTPLAEHEVTPGERLDVVAARYFGDSTRFWLLCDANRVLDPRDLEVAGVRIVVAMPGAHPGGLGQ